MAIIHGTAGNDQVVTFHPLIGTNGTDYIYAKAGHDDLFGRDGNDYLFGEDGNDVLYGGEGNDFMDGGRNDDTFHGGGGNDHMFGRDGNDRFNGDAGADRFDGGGGFDSVNYSGSAAVTVDLTQGTGSGGNAAGDKYTSIEWAVGSSNNDTLIGSSGFDRLWGGSGNDILDGRAGLNQFDGGWGNDLIRAGSGADVIDDFTGFDTVSYIGSTAAVTVNLQTGVGQGGYAQGDSYKGIEHITGSVFHDVLIGSHSNAVGQLTDNVIRGEAGNDVLRGGWDADTLNGGTGVDTASYAGSGPVKVYLDGSLPHQGEHAEGDVLVGIEYLEGSSYGDVLRGNSGSNELKGGGGNDTLQGLSNNDSLLGGSGDDVLEGGSGVDFIEGGTGRDILSGGAHIDYFVFRAINESGKTSATRDVINDFQSGLDIISIADLDAKVGQSGYQAFDFVGTNAFSAEGQVRYFHQGGNTIIEINNAGTNGAEMQIALAGTINVTASDFYL